MGAGASPHVGLYRACSQMETSFFSYPRWWGSPPPLHWPTPVGPSGPLGVRAALWAIQAPINTSKDDTPELSSRFETYKGRSCFSD